jgi:DNA modification methylase
MFNRDNTLTVINLDVDTSFLNKRRVGFNWISSVYENLSNHGYCCVLLYGDGPNRSGNEWELAADLILYAEKFLSTELNQPYFDWRKIAAVTQKYIPTLNSKRAKFELLQHGLYYKDCFFVGDNSANKLLLIFQKNEPDETTLPCPACRSHNVQGNSYSTLGVRSWECNNLICPGRSKFNRGKRYSFLQILKQRALECPQNAIPRSSVRQWARDVQPSRTQAEILPFRIKHYTLVGDHIHLINWREQPDDEILSRLVHHKPLTELSSSHPKGALAPDDFFSSPYFQRFCVDRPALNTAESCKTVSIGLAKAIRGDAHLVLKDIPSDSIDGAVTSPPYYNAREYSQWPNIYCYLHDMYNVAKEIIRVLKPGSAYAYNIFDYFDNENNVALSAMGDRRMVLSAYTVDLFRRVGFECWGNIVWDKGEIEGKRGFNGGNFSPYYQAPFNCWEHVLIFREPALDCASMRDFPRVIARKPVIKMIRGENVHGHTAPFPPELPSMMIIEHLFEGAVVLDPFAGSMTTGIVANQYGLRSINIEINPGYFELGCKRLWEGSRQGTLL